MTAAAQPIQPILDVTGTGIREISDLTRQAAQPVRLDAGEIWLVHNGDGTSDLHDLTGDQYLDQPRRIRQTVQLTDVDSLLAYWDKHHDGSSEVYANREAHTVTAVLDAHHPADLEDDEDEEPRARWQSHRAVLALTLSDPLQAWMKHNGHLFTQDGFAEFIEEHMTYIADPAAADLLEMAQSFHATIGASFKSGFKLVSGQRQLEYTEQVDASVKGGSLPVPQTVTVRLPIWHGANTAEELVARIRYRVNHGGAGRLGIGYKLERPTETIDAAFEAVLHTIDAHVGVPVLRGTPGGA